MAQHAIIRLPKIKSCTGLGRSEIYRREALGEFPRRVSIGARSVGWVETEVQDWIEARICERRSGGAMRWKQKHPARVAIRKPEQIFKCGNGERTATLQCMVCPCRGLQGPNRLFAPSWVKELASLITRILISVLVLLMRY